MKYKLINKEGVETPCDKVTIDGYDYYVSDEISMGMNNVWVATKSRVFKFEMYMAVISDDIPRLIIATNNPNIIDIPQVVDEVEMLANIEYPFAFGGIGNIENTSKNHFIKGYNKSQETHPFSEEDMIEFGDWVYRSQFDVEGYTQDKETKELFQLWKEQKSKTIYYE